MGMRNSMGRRRKKLKRRTGKTEKKRREREKKSKEGEKKKGGGTDTVIERKERIDECINTDYKVEGKEIN